MIDFATLNSQCMGVFSKIQPMFTDPRDGHMWTGRLELAGIIERIESWMRDNGRDLVELSQAAELRDYFKSLPHAQYTCEECIAALKQETDKFTGRKKR